MEIILINCPFTYNLPRPRVSESEVLQLVQMSCDGDGGDARR